MAKKKRATASDGFKLATEFAMRFGQAGVKRPKSPAKPAAPSARQRRSSLILDAAKPGRKRKR